MTYVALLPRDKERENVPWSNDQGEREVDNERQTDGPTGNVKDSGTHREETTGTYITGEMELEEQAGPWRRGHLDHNR